MPLSDLRDLRRRVALKLVDLAALDPGKDLILEPFGDGVRVSILARAPRGKAALELTVTAAKLRGTIRDQVNGIVGRLIQEATHAAQ